MSQNGKRADSPVVRLRRVLCKLYSYSEAYPERTDTTLTMITVRKRVFWPVVVDVQCHVDS